TPFTFTVSLTGSTALVTTVDFATANGTATGALLCTATKIGRASCREMTYPAGTTAQTETEPVCGDTTFEANETFIVNLSNPTNATISDGQGLGTIITDGAPHTLRPHDLSSDVCTADLTPFTFTVSLTGSTALVTTVDFATANGTATGALLCTAT